MSHIALNHYCTTSCVAFQVLECEGARRQDQAGIPWFNWKFTPLNPRAAASARYSQPQNPVSEINVRKPRVHGNRAMTAGAP
jgi:hypothetical protein